MTQQQHDYPCYLFTQMKIIVNMFQKMKTIASEDIYTVHQEGGNNQTADEIFMFWNLIIIYNNCFLWIFFYWPVKISQ